MSTIFFRKNADAKCWEIPALAGVIGVLLLHAKSYSQINLNFPETFIPVQWNSVESSPQILMAVMLGLLGGCTLAILLIVGVIKLAEQINQKKIEQAFKERLWGKTVQEIRSSMNGVVGVARLLNATEVTAEQREYMDLLCYSSEHSLVLLDNIQNLSQIESGCVPLECCSFDLYSTIKGVIFQRTLEAQEKGIGLHYYYETDAQKYFMGDPIRIGQIVGNLIDNAIKFTPKGCISLEVMDRSHPDSSDGEVSICVRDTGVGIPLDLQKVIFEKFPKCKKESVTNLQRGEIGLFIAHSLAKTMGGKLEVKSDGVNGAEFTFSLNLRKDFHGNLFPETISGIHVGCPFAKEFFPEQAEYCGNIQEQFEHGERQVISKDLKVGTGYSKIENEMSEGVKKQKGRLSMEALLISLLKKCPWGEAKKDCPLRDLRMLPAEQGMFQIRQMTRAEKMKICEAHQLCISRR